MASVSAFADSFQFSGSGLNGFLQTGQAFAYNGDGGVLEPDWGIPGLNLGTDFWTGPTVSQFMVTFNLPAGIIIDPAQVLVGNGANCGGTTTGGTTFCADPYSAPWKAALIGNNGIMFTSSRDLLTSGDDFFVNIFFSGGDPSGAAFSGEFSTPVSEPSNPMLLGSGLLALVGGLRRKLLL